MNHTLTARLDTFHSPNSNRNLSNLFYELGPKWDPKTKIKQANESYKAILNHQLKQKSKSNLIHPINSNDTSYQSFYKELNNQFNAMTIGKTHLNNQMLIKSSSLSQLFPTLLDIAKKQMSIDEANEMKEQSEYVVNINHIRLPIKKLPPNSFYRTIMLKRDSSVKDTIRKRKFIKKKVEGRYLEAELPLDNKTEEMKSLKQYEMREYIDKRKVIPFK